MFSSHNIEIYSIVFSILGIVLSFLSGRNIYYLVSELNFRLDGNQRINSMKMARLISLIFLMSFYVALIISWLLLLDGLINYLEHIGVYNSVYNPEAYVRGGSYGREELYLFNIKIGFFLEAVYLLLIYVSMLAPVLIFTKMRDYIYSVLHQITKNYFIDIQGKILFYNKAIFMFGTLLSSVSVILAVYLFLKNNITTL